MSAWVNGAFAAQARARPAARRIGSVRGRLRGRVRRDHFREIKRRVTAHCGRRAIEARRAARRSPRQAVGPVTLILDVGALIAVEQGEQRGGRIDQGAHGGAFAGHPWRHRWPGLAWGDRSRGSRGPDAAGSRSPPPSTPRWGGRPALCLAKRGAPTSSMPRSPSLRPMAIRF